MTQLNEKQISSLFDFVRSKYVRYVDVQHELVDHLASDIEVEMDADASLTFDEALHKVYAKFPISGFSQYVSKSESNLHKFWGRLIFSQFAKYAGLPLLISLSILTYIQYLMMITFGTPCIITLLISVVIFNFWSIKKFRTVIKNDKNIDDSYLVVSVFKGFALGFSFFPIMFSQLVDDTVLSSAVLHNPIKLIILAILLSLAIIWSVMAYYRFPQLIRSVLNEKYAHLKLSV